jgi:hypothetical protein
MGRHRYDTQIWSGEHHNGVILGHATAFGDEFSLAWMGEAHGVKLGLRHRTCHERRRAAGTCKADGHFQCLIGAMRAVQIGLPRHHRNAAVQLDHRKGGVKMREAVRRIVDLDDGPVPVRREATDIANGEKGRKIRAFARLPCFADNLRTYACRVADRNRQRQVKSPWRHQLYSMTASRRRSRR